MGIIDWLVSKGTAAIDAASAEVRTVLTDFSRDSMALEKLYLEHYVVRAKMGDDYPAETYFDNLAVHVKDERETRLTLLKIFHAAGVDPAPYGIFTAGLNPADVEKAYPGYKFGAVPVLMIGAALVLYVLTLTYAIQNVMAEKSGYDLRKMLVEKYTKQGMSVEQAEIAARTDAEKIKAESGVDLLGGITQVGSTIKIVAIALAAMVVLGD